LPNKNTFTDKLWKVDSEELHRYQTTQELTGLGHARL